MQPTEKWGLLHIIFHKQPTVAFFLFFFFFFFFFFGGGGGGCEERVDMNTKAAIYFYTRHIVTASSTEPDDLMKIFLMILKIEGIVALTIKRR